MIEVKCNGKIYVFPEGSEIIDHLDMTAQDVRDEPDRCSLYPDLAKTVKPVTHPIAENSQIPVVNGRVYTRDIAAMCVELFEGLLDEHDIEIECGDPDEQAERQENNGGGALYGTEYSDLLDSVEDLICDTLDAYSYARNYIRDEFSGET